MAVVSISAPGNDMKLVTKHDTDPLPLGDNGHACRALYVGAGGRLIFKTPYGNTVDLPNVADDRLLPFEATHVLATNNTCTNIYAIY